MDELKQEMKICINGIRESVGDLREIVESELSRPRAEDVDIELVRKLRKAINAIEERL